MSFYDKKRWKLLLKISIFWVSWDVDTQQGSYKVYLFRMSYHDTSKQAKSALHSGKLLDRIVHLVRHLKICISSNRRIHKPHCIILWVFTGWRTHVLLPLPGVYYFVHCIPHITSTHGPIIIVTMVPALLYRGTYRTFSNIHTHVTFGLIGYIGLWRCSL